MWKQTNSPDTASVPPPPSKPTMSNGPTTMSEPVPTRTTLASTTSTDQAAIIGKSLVIKGEITGSESLHIEGKVEGSINLPGTRVTVGRNGQVSADITAREIIVQGKILGNVNASDRLDVRSEGALTGDVIAQRISVEDGAFFKGKIDVRRAGQSGEKINSGSESKEVAEQPMKIA
ncbi:MAG TPA: polymer-forming cytoskeletal protein [Terriglobales bacterium]|jgi:cytoskeletal protein CcmA (bactofilin family)|nr:polymer-forming cytoskeletal protein [Terriglobales bacterium]